MPKYLIDVWARESVVYTAQLEVEAESEDAAREEYKDMSQADDIPWEILQDATDWEEGVEKVTLAVDADEEL